MNRRLGCARARAPPTRQRDPAAASRCEPDARDRVRARRHQRLDAEPGRARPARPVARHAAQHRRRARDRPVPPARGGGPGGRASCGAASAGSSRPRTASSASNCFRRRLEGAFEIALWELHPGASRLGDPRAHPGEEANLFLRGPRAPRDRRRADRARRRRLRHVRPPHAAPRHRRRRRSRRLRRRDQPARVVTVARGLLSDSRSAQAAAIMCASQRISVTGRRPVDVEESMRHAENHRVDRLGPRAGGSCAVAVDGARARTTALSVGSAGAKSTKTGGAGDDEPHHVVLGQRRRTRRRQVARGRREVVRGEEPEHQDQGGRRRPAATFIATFQAAAAAKSRARHRRAVGDRARS